jgi:hypothetical protein
VLDDVLCATTRSLTGSENWKADDSSYAPYSDGSWSSAASAAMKFQG